MGSKSKKTESSIMSEFRLGLGDFVITLESSFLRKI
jgi:hypothetical protein